jgi:DNA polymerase-1
MIDLDAALEGGAASMLLQVHDELVLEAPEGDAGDVARVVVEVMEGVVMLDVPLVADVATGKTLADTKK